METTAQRKRRLEEIERRKRAGQSYDDLMSPLNPASPIYQALYMSTINTPIDSTPSYSPSDSGSSYSSSSSFDSGSSGGGDGGGGGGGF